MNFSKFFISRPIFAAVLSLLILIAGAISLFQLPISEYPEVVPPTVVVRASFPGANPKVMAKPSPRHWNRPSPVSRACSTCRPRPPPTAN
ncbi:Multidrug efflux pump subunit AcrB [Pseudomonas syringae pv. actinidiae]|nr:Multidrug efflux pump subunit AcrB [Pseudomonas syringae pv. actinidiae]